MKLQSYEDYKKKALAGRPGLRALYAKSQVKHDMICKVIDARLAKKMTQGQLAKKVLTKQSVISRFESGQSNPSYEFLQKVADAVGKSLFIEIS